MNDGSMELAKFELDKTVRLAKLRVDLMRAQGELAAKRVEIAKKQVELCRDMTRLGVLRNAFRRHITEQKRLLRQRRSLENAYEMCVGKARDARNVARGEFLPANLVRFVWIGFTYFLRSISIKAPPLTVQHRKGFHFSWNRDRNKQCEDAPESTGHVITLVEWMRAGNLMPKVGSPPWLLMMEVVNALNETADNAMTQVIDRLVVLEDKLAEHDEAGWEEAAKK